MLPSLKEKLSRVSNQKFIPEIDGLRFLAIFLVILLHAKTTIFKEFHQEFPLEELLKNPLFVLIFSGNMGVCIFFSISGFILAMPFSKASKENRPAPSLKSFYLKRLTRLEPPFLLVMLVLFLVYGFQKAGFTISSFQHFFASIAYSHHFIYGTWSPINPVTWSLETEVQFYVLLPLFALLFRLPQVSIRWFLLLVFCLVFTEFTFTNDLTEYHLNKSLLRYGGFFFVGMFFADLFQINSDFVQGKKSVFFDILGVLSFCFLIGEFFVALPKEVLLVLYRYNFLWIFPLFLSVFRGIGLSWFFTRPWIVILGGMCYTIYLIHYPILFFLGKKMAPFLGKFSQDFWWIYLPFLLISLVVLMIVSALFFIFFEKPFMYRDWPKRFMAFLGRN